jgi:uncharacterized alkaline shock family protein YloU
VTPPRTGTRADDLGVLAELVVAATLEVDGVTGLHGGSHGEVATYLPGRQVSGVLLRDDVTEVHVTVVMGARLLEVAGEVRRVVSGLVPTPVVVVVEDVTTS